jgi:anti-sigma factor RsiW
MYVRRGKELFMSDCRTIHILLGRYFDRELLEPERRLVEAHLKQCSLCSAELQQIHEIDGAFRKGMSTPQVPSDMTQRIMEKARAQVGVTFPRWDFLRFWKNWSLSMRLAAIGVATIACYVGIAIGGSSLPTIRSATAEMRWIDMTSQAPIVKAYMGTER